MFEGWCAGMTLGCYSSIKKQAHKAVRSFFLFGGHLVICVHVHVHVCSIANVGPHLAVARTSVRWCIA